MLCSTQPCLLSAGVSSQTHFLCLLMRTSQATAEQPHQYPTVLSVLLSPWKANIQRNYTARMIPPQQIHNSFYFCLFSPSLRSVGFQFCPFLGVKVKSATCNSLTLPSLRTGSDFPPFSLVNPLVPGQFSDLQLCSNFSWFSKIRQNEINWGHWTWRPEKASALSSGRWEHRYSSTDEITGKHH